MHQPLSASNPRGTRRFEYFRPDYLRTLLTHGARCVLANAKDPGLWVEQLKKRKPVNVVVIALANKIARIIWAVLAHGRPYDKGYASVRPA
ncbi:transposase [Paraburkholderia youngii]